MVPTAWDPFFLAADEVLCLMHVLLLLLVVIEQQKYCLNSINSWSSSLWEWRRQARTQSEEPPGTSQKEAMQCQEKRREQNPETVFYAFLSNKMSAHWSCGASHALPVTGIWNFNCHENSRQLFMHWSLWKSLRTIIQSSRVILPSIHAGVSIQQTATTNTATTNDS